MGKLGGELAAGGAGATAGPTAAPPRREPARPAEVRAPVPARPIHRWRDLDRQGRRWAVALALALLLAPAAALVELWPGWTPNGDPGLMALRALDVGTSRTPLLGQPSQSLAYAGSVSPVHHPGPIHFYLLALPLRLLGGSLAMPLVSAAVAGACLVTSAWAVFRQLGRTAGVVAAALLSLVAFTAGAASMVNPVSSVIAGYPLLLTAVLAWCLACGDVRLLPAAVAAASFTAQQHLSVVAATVVVVAGGVGLLLVAGWREGRWHDPAERRGLARAGGVSLAVGLVLWAPVLAQQAFGNSGNLSQMVWFARHDGSERLGYSVATRQVAHAVGLPPLLGRTELDGTWLNSAPSVVGWASAALVLALVAAISVRWRRSDARAARLGAMVAVLVLAGLYNGASVPVGLEQGRLTFYHWVFPLALFVALVVALGAVRAGGRLLATRGVRGGIVTALAIGVVVAPSLVNPALGRTSSTLPAAYVHLDHDQVADLADAAADHADALGDHPVLLERNGPPYVMYGATLLYALVDRDVPVHASLRLRFFVNDDRLVDRDRLTGGVIVVVDDEMPSPSPGGELVAEIDLDAGLDVDAYRTLVGAAEDAATRSTGSTGDGDDAVRLGPALEDTLSTDEQAWVTAALGNLVDDPETALLHPEMLRLLAEHPAPASPALDPALAAQVLSSLEARSEPWHPGTATGIRLFVADRAETLAVATRGEIGQAGGDDQTAASWH